MLSPKVMMQDVLEVLIPIMTLLLGPASMRRHRLFMTVLSCMPPWSGSRSQSKPTFKVKLL